MGFFYFINTVHIARADPEFGNLSIKQRQQVEADAQEVKGPHEMISVSIVGSGLSISAALIKDSVGL